MEKKERVTQLAVSDRLGISNQALSDWLLGKSNVPAPRAVAWSKVLGGKPWRFIFTEDGELLTDKNKRRALLGLAPKG